MLASGCAAHVAAIHGESVKVLSGPDAGQWFVAVREIESDQILSTDLGDDPRAKIFLRFMEDSTPQLGMTGRVQTEDGRKWTAIRRQEAGFLTTDYELTEIVPGKDS